MEEPSQEPEDHIKCMYKPCELFCCMIPRRYVIAIMSFLAIAIAYAMRICLNQAIVEMAINVESANGTRSAVCDLERSVLRSIDVSEKFHWSSQLQGIIKSSFYWGYIVTHIPGALLAERFGAKHVIGLGVLITAIMTLLTPLAIYNGGASYLIVVRVIEGLGEGTTYPAINALLSEWVPLRERGTIGSIVYAGSQIGTVFGQSVSGYIAERYDWPALFYFFGATGCVWWFFWNLLCFNKPQAHPYITARERTFIQSHVGHTLSDGFNLPPYWILIRSAPVLALIAAQIGHDWGFYTMVTDLPKFMKDVLGVRIEANGFMSSIPMVAMWLVSLMSGLVADYLVRSGRLTVTGARKLFTSIAATGPATFLVLASYLGCDRLLVVGSFTFGMSLMGTYYCGMRVNALDLAPNYAGTLMAVTNGIGVIAGILTPYVTGVITSSGSAESWQTVFWISFCIFVVTNLIYLIFGSAEVQWWNDYPNTREPPATTN